MLHDLANDGSCVSYATSNSELRTGRSTLAMDTVDTTDATARSWRDMPNTSASDLSGLSCSPF